MSDAWTADVSIDDQWWFSATDIEEATKAVHGVLYKPSHLGNMTVRMRIPKFHGGVKHAYLFRRLHELRPEKFSVEVFQRLVRKNPKQVAGDVPGFPLSRDLDDLSTYPLHPAYEGHLRSKAESPHLENVIAPPPAASILDASREESDAVESILGRMRQREVRASGVSVQDIRDVHQRLTAMAARQEGGGENVLAFLDVFRDLLVAKAT